MGNMKSKLTFACVTTALASSTACSVGSNQGRNQGGGDAQAVITQAQFQSAEKIVKAMTQSIEFIPFGYAQDGCYARALYMSMALAANGIASSSYFVAGALKVADARKPGEFIRWQYHVAPMFDIKEGTQQLSPQQNPQVPNQASRPPQQSEPGTAAFSLNAPCTIPAGRYILDPSLSAQAPALPVTQGCSSFDGFMTVQTWHELMGVPGNTQATIGFPMSDGAPNKHNSPEPLEKERFKAWFVPGSLYPFLNSYAEHTSSYRKEVRSMADMPPFQLKDIQGACGTMHSYLGNQGNDAALANKKRNNLADLTVVAIHSLARQGRLQAGVDLARAQLQCGTRPLPTLADAQKRLNASAETVSPSPAQNTPPVVAPATSQMPAQQTEMQQTQQTETQQTETQQSEMQLK